MFSRFFVLLMMLFYLGSDAQAVHVVLTGGPSLMKWEGLRVQADRHDNWWANFIRASTLRISHIQAKDPGAKICWVVYKPGYVTRGKEDGKPYVSWINELAGKYKVQLVWADTADQAINALNRSAKTSGKIQSFYYFGHSNPYAFMLDYGNEVMAVSTQFIHETDLLKVDPAAFLPNADCWSYGCYTGMSMSQWWKKIVGVPMWGNTESTRYGPVSSGKLPEGVGKWVR